MTSLNTALVRAFRQADYEALARLRSLSDPGRPTTAEEECTKDERTLPCHRRRRWTAENEAAPIGFGEYLQNHRTPPDGYLLFLAVNPAYHGCGVGAALYDEVLQTLRELGAAEVITNMSRHQARGVRFFEERGFRITNSSRRMRLDLPSFGLDPWRGHVEAFGRQGYTFRPLSELLLEEGGASALWQLHRTTSVDIPMRHAPAPETLDEFRRRVLEHPNLILVGSFAALWGQTVAGVTEIERTADINRVNVSYTGVLPSHRGRGLGLALKLRSIEFAQSAGFRQMSTNNHEGNAPMLSINSKLGFERTEDRLTLTLELPRGQAA